LLDCNALFDDESSRSGQVAGQKTDMPLALGTCIGINADMHLQRSDLEPRAAPRLEFVGLVYLRKGENLAVEFQALVLENAWNGDLDVIDAENIECHG